MNRDGYFRFCEDGDTGRLAVYETQYLTNGNESIIVPVSGLFGGPLPEGVARLAARFTKTALARASMDGDCFDTMMGETVYEMAECALDEDGDREMKTKLESERRSLRDTENGHGARLEEFSGLDCVTEAEILGASAPGDDALAQDWVDFMKRNVKYLGTGFDIRDYMEQDDEYDEGYLEPAFFYGWTWDTDPDTSVLAAETVNLMNAGFECGAASVCFVQSRELGSGTPDGATFSGWFAFHTQLQERLDDLAHRKNTHKEIH